MPQNSRRVFIIVKAPNGDVREVPIAAGAAVVIGRDESADIRVEDKKVSRRHAAFKLVDGEPWVEDLGSANGVKLNGKRVDKRARFGVDDKVRVGGYQVTLKDLVEDTGSGQMDDRPSQISASISKPIGRDEVTPSRAAGTSGLGATAIKPKKGTVMPDDGKSPVLAALDEPVKNQRFVLHPGENIIGRLEECDVPVLDGSVSRQHARVVFARDRLSVTDLGSSNGMFVNDMRVEMAELQNGDMLRIGNIRFKVELPPELSKAFASAPAKTKPRAAREAPPGRPWAFAGMIVLLLAIAVLSFTIYYKWRAKMEREAALAAGAVDAGGAEVAAAVPDATAPAEVVRTIEPVVPVGTAVPDSGVVEIVRAPVTPPPVTPPPVTPPPVTPPVRTPTESIAAVPTSTVPRVYAFGPVVTATSPYSAKDANGMPANLPAVDERFDFDAFVAEKLAAVQSTEKDGDWTKLRAAVSELLARDPINAEGKETWKRVVLHETASEAIANAEELITKGELAKALKAYQTVPEAAPEAAQAKMKVEELRVKAVEQELDKAEKYLDKKATWMKAHRSFHDVLDLEPENTRALEGIRTVERKMRKKNIGFAAYVPENRATKEVVRSTPEDIEQALSKHYGGDDSLARIAQLYSTGQIAEAAKKAAAVEKKAEGDKKDSAKKIKDALKRIQALNERIKNEISNDPNQAWEKLNDLGRAEEDILPRDVRSYVRIDLERDVAEAFANAGNSLSDRENFPEAFNRWESGFKLDATNTKILAGFKKLEERAKKLSDEADVASQRGDRKACEKWKEITHITRPDSEVRKRAIDNLRANCSG